ncbi:MAG: hypothetical protein HOV68_30570 [Streptomycetaceae bacterium]|nr:hypothetical protein [Streptomycetaceae bacterium]
MATAPDPLLRDLADAIREAITDLNLPQPVTEVRFGIDPDFDNGPDYDAVATLVLDDGTRTRADFAPTVARDVLIEIRDEREDFGLPLLPFTLDLLPS